jgi:hypothetical protein
MLGVILIFILCLSAYAQLKLPDDIKAKVDCGTLVGEGIVRLHTPYGILRVDIKCPNNKLDI